jgi:hypothetical protein
VSAELASTLLLPLVHEQAVRRTRIPCLKIQKNVSDREAGRPVSMKSTGRRDHWFTE